MTISLFEQSTIRACRVCGCSEYDPCIDPATDEPCHWVEWDLCSACVPPARRVPPPSRHPMVEIATAAIGTVSTHVLVAFAMGVLP